VQAIPLAVGTLVVSLDPKPIATMFHAGPSAAAICLVVLTTECGLLAGVLEDRADDP
jgi:Flp pilus assembly protein TadB